MGYYDVTNDIPLEITIDGILKDIQIVVYYVNL
jgi:hypothetical protein